MVEIDPPYRVFKKNSLSVETKEKQQNPPRVAKSVILFINGNFELKVPQKYMHTIRKRRKKLPANICFLYDLDC